MTDEGAISDLLQKFPDSHCHVHAFRSPDHRRDSDESPVSGDGMRVVCGTSPGVDWATIRWLSSRTADRQSTVFGFGVHPWWATQVDIDAALAELDGLLQDHPSAIVGEIGIDTATLAPPQSEGGSCCERGAQDAASPAPAASPTDGALARQQLLFEAQLDLAGRYQRPVSVHVVGNGAYGIVRGCFERVAGHNRAAAKAQSSPAMRPLPPAVIFHRFTGSADFLAGLEKLFPEPGKNARVRVPSTRFYVGLGGPTALRTKAILQCARGIFASAGAPPMTFRPNQVLLESDRHYTIDGATLRIADPAERAAVAAEVLGLCALLTDGDTAAGQQEVMERCRGNLLSALGRGS